MLTDLLDVVIAVVVVLPTPRCPFPSLSCMPGTILAYGVLGASAPLSPWHTVNLARGPSLKNERLVCVLHGASAPTATAVWGLITATLGDVENSTAVSVAGDYAGLAAGATYLLEMYSHGGDGADAFGLAEPYGPRPGTGQACYDPSITFGFLGSFATTAATAQHRTLLRPPRQGTLSPFVGRGCVLSKASASDPSQAVQVVAAGVWGMAGATAALDTAGTDVAVAIPQDCRAPPVEIKIAEKEGKPRTEHVPNDMGLVIGLSVGLPLLALAISVFVWSHCHHKETTKIMQRTHTMLQEVAVREHHVIHSGDNSKPAPPVPHAHRSMRFGRSARENAGSSTVLSTGMSGGSLTLNVTSSVADFHRSAGSHIDRPISLRLPNGRVQVSVPSRFWCPHLQLLFRSLVLCLRVSPDFCV